jgi:RecJ-like exonuclease
MTITHESIESRLASSPCPDCRGRGTITLLLSVEACGRCGGTGAVFDNPLMNRPVGELEMSIRTRKVLQRLGVETVGQLARLSAEAIQKDRFANALVVQEIAQILRKLGVVGN